MQFGWFVETPLPVAEADDPIKKSHLAELTCEGSNSIGAKEDAFDVTRLPHDILVHIFSLLHRAEDRVALCLTCKTFHSICLLEDLWLPRIANEITNAGEEREAFLENVAAWKATLYKSVLANDDLREAGGTGDEHARAASIERRVVARLYHFIHMCAPLAGIWQPSGCTGYERYGALVQFLWSVHGMTAWRLMPLTLQRVPILRIPVDIPLGSRVTTLFPLESMRGRRYGSSGRTRHMLRAVQGIVNLEELRLNANLWTEDGSSIHLKRSGTGERTLNIDAPPTGPAPLRDRVWIRSARATAILGGALGLHLALNKSIRLLPAFVWPRDAHRVSLSPRLMLVRELGVPLLTAGHLGVRKLRRLSIPVNDVRLQRLLRSVAHGSLGALAGGILGALWPSVAAKSRSLFSPLGTLFNGRRRTAAQSADMTEKFLLTDLSCRLQLLLIFCMVDRFIWPAPRKRFRLLRFLANHAPLKWLGFGRKGSRGASDPTPPTESVFFRWESAIAAFCLVQLTLGWEWQYTPSSTTSGWAQSRLRTRPSSASTEMPRSSSGDLVSRDRQDFGGWYGQPAVFGFRARMKFYGPSRTIATLKQLLPPPMRYPHSLMGLWRVLPTHANNWDEIGNEGGLERALDTQPTIVFAVVRKGASSMSADNLRSEEQNPPLQSYAVLGGGSLPAGQRITFEIDEASCCSAPPRDRSERVMLRVANILTQSHYMGTVHLGEATHTFTARTCWLGQEDIPCTGQIIHYADTGFMALVIRNRSRQGLAFIFFSRSQIDRFYHFAHLSDDDGAAAEFRS
mmetsp:Transcript_12279/g.44771  ORF Transcript_12279/g.44771 Transcript_12279/m.44771 type:complete len:797 (-) Transcript_12279:1753-4143(-)